MKWGIEINLHKKSLREKKTDDFVKSILVCKETRHFSSSCCWVVFIYLHGVSFDTLFLIFLSQGCLNMPALFHRTGTLVECCCFQSSWILILCQYVPGYFQSFSVKAPVRLKKRKLFSFHAARNSSLIDSTKALSVLWLDLEAWSFYIELNLFPFSLELKESQKWMSWLDSSAGNEDGIYFGELRCRRLRYPLFWIWNLFARWISWVRLNGAASGVPLCISHVTLCAFRLITVPRNARCMEIEWYW